MKFNLQDKILALTQIRSASNECRQCFHDDVGVSRQASRLPGTARSAGHETPVGCYCTGHDVSWRQLDLSLYVNTLLNILLNLDIYLGLGLFGF